MFRFYLIFLTLFALDGRTAMVRAADSSAAATAASAATSAASTATLEWQVLGLSTLQDLDLTPEQLKSLSAMADQTAINPADAPTIPSISSIPYHDALLAFRDGLAAGDDDKIGDAQDKVDSLREKLKIPPPPELTSTDAARMKSRAAMHLLTTGQIADFLAMHADEIPDAGDTLDDALDQCRDGTDADFSALRDQAAAQVALLAGGTDEKVTAAFSKRVSDLLDRARQMSADQFDARRPELDRSARAIIRGIDPFEALHRWMLNQIALLLSNPQLGPILEMRRSAQRSG